MPIGVLAPKESLNWRAALINPTTITTRGSASRWEAPSSATRLYQFLFAKDEMPKGHPRLQQPRQGLAIHSSTIKSGSDRCCRTDQKDLWKKSRFRACAVRHRRQHLKLQPPHEPRRMSIGINDDQHLRYHIVLRE